MYIRYMAKLYVDHSYKYDKREVFLCLLTLFQGSCPTEMETSLKKLKRQKTETKRNLTPAENTNIKSETEKSEKMCETECLARKEDRLVNWMSMNETQFLHCDKAKDGESNADCDDTDGSDDEDDIGCHEEDIICTINNDHKEGQASESSRTPNEMKYTREELFHDHTKTASGEIMEFRLDQIKKKEVEKMINYKSSTPGKKPPKVAFCPREVKRVIECEDLQQKNAQFHTIRKIIVFASLGISHGCEDVHELDFNHFSILRKGEPYETSNPGVRKLSTSPS